MLFGLSPAKGWHDVPAVINDHHPSAQSRLKVLGLLNVTAVLAGIDAAVEAHLAKSPWKQ
jgi:hypothetical protein